MGKEEEEEDSATTEGFRCWEGWSSVEVCSHALSPCIEETVEGRNTSPEHPKKPNLGQVPFRVRDFKQLLGSLPKLVDLNLDGGFLDRISYGIHVHSPLVRQVIKHFQQKKEGKKKEKSNCSLSERVSVPASRDPYSCRP